MRKITIESIIAGTVGAIVMLPPGFIFRALNMRVGHYGAKFAELYLTSPGPTLLFIQHLVLGWISAIPMVLLPLQTMNTGKVSFIGAVYGAMYYVAVNSLALPLYFKDELPWNLGWSVVLPSLVVHIVFGMTVALSVKYLRRKSSAA